VTGLLSDIPAKDVQFFVTQSIHMIENIPISKSPLQVFNFIIPRIPHNLQPVMIQKPALLPFSGKFLSISAQFFGDKPHRISIPRRKMYQGQHNSCRALQIRFSTMPKPQISNNDGSLWNNRLCRRIILPPIF
jgi:hypothetical protein